MSNKSGESALPLGKAVGDSSTQNEQESGGEVKSELHDRGSRRL